MKVRDLVKALLDEDMDDEVLIETKDAFTISIDGILSPSNARSHVGVVFLSPDTALVCK